jgi:hypothetical protein
MIKILNCEKAVFIDQNNETLIENFEDYISFIEISHETLKRLGYLESEIELSFSEIEKESFRISFSNPYGSYNSRVFEIKGAIKPYYHKEVNQKIEKFLELFK